MKERLRLQKYLSECGVGSRRKCEEYIAQGRLTVNGNKISKPGFTVSYDDEVLLDNKVIKPENRKIYIMLNKPEGYITTVSDQFSRKTIMSLVNEIKYRIYPVGRLDYNTSGLIFLTNDGDFAKKVSHPSSCIIKTYIAKVKGIPDENDIRAFKEGINTGDFISAPAEMQILRKGKNISEIRIKIHEGKNRQIRKMCNAIGMPVVSLKRISVGVVELGRLETGKWRHLNKYEIDALLNNQLK